MTSDLKDEFEKLWNSKDRAKRGRLFEALFCRLLFRSGFIVHKDPKSANPRQTDLLAEYGNDKVLFETKWQKRKVDIDAVAQIKDRLGRASKDTIGCICSVSGFTETLIKDVEDQRSQYEILLLNPYEIYGLFAQKLGIFELIDRKRRVLSRDGVMWFFGQSPRDSRSRYVEMPPSHESINLPACSIMVRLASKHISDILFARTPLIFDEYLWAASLRIRLNSSSANELREVFIAAENYLGLRGMGTFGIRQQASGWYGLGSDNFLKEVGLYSQRYKGYTDRIHHSEELAFFDELNGGGIFLLSARQSLTRPGQIHSGEVIVRLPGVPSNTEPFNRFIRSVTPDSVLFSPEEPLRRHHCHLPSSVRIYPRDFIASIGSSEIKHSEGAISGVVVTNPFFGDPKRIAEFSNDEQLLAFSEPEYLICSLDDWLEAGDKVDYYRLTGLEVLSVDEAVLLHPRCTWGNLTKRAHPKSSSGFRKIEAEWKYRERLLKQIKKASRRK